MKTISTTLVLFLLAAGASTNADAQGPFQFTADLRVLDPLPGQEPFFGQGTFSLEGNLFRYRVVILPYAPGPPRPDAAVRGTGLDGPVLFDLRFIGCVPPLEPYDPGGCGFRGSVEVPDSQIADLLANQWYVTASLHADVDVNYAGRIELVPEPGPTALLCVSAVVSSVCFCVRLIRRRAWTSPLTFGAIDNPASRSCDWQILCGYPVSAV